MVSKSKGFWLSIGFLVDGVRPWPRRDDLSLGLVN
jgi:hypothetical protein